MEETERDTPDTISVSEDLGLWIPEHLREFTAQIVFRTPKTTIQHFESDGGNLGTHYRVITPDQFDTDPDCRNENLYPDKVSIMPQGEDEEIFTVEIHDSLK